MIPLHQKLQIYCVDVYECTPLCKDKKCNIVHYQIHYYCVFHLYKPMWLDEYIKTLAPTLALPPPYHKDLVRAATVKTVWKRPPTHSKSVWLWGNEEDSHLLGWQNDIILELQDSYQIISIQTVLFRAWHNGESMWIVPA